MTYYAFLDDFLMPSVLYRVCPDGGKEVWSDGNWVEIDISAFGEVFEIDKEAARKAFPPEAFT